MNKEHYEERTCATCGNVFSLTVTAKGDVITEAPEVCGKDINFNSEICLGRVICWPNLPYGKLES